MPGPDLYQLTVERADDSRDMSRESITRQIVFAVCVVDGSGVEHGPGWQN